MFNKSGTKTVEKFKRKCEKLASKYTKKCKVEKVNIIIIPCRCGRCGKKFKGEMYESIILNEYGEYDRYYGCIECYSTYDDFLYEHNEKVDMKVKNLLASNLYRLI